MFTQLIVSLRSISFYLIVFLLIAVLGLNISMSTILDAAKDPQSGRDYVYAAMFWSLIAYPVLMLLYLLKLRIWAFFNTRRIGSKTPYRLGMLLSYAVKEDVTNPFTFATRDSRETQGWFIHLTGAILFWLLLAITVAVLATA